MEEIVTAKSRYEMESKYPTIGSHDTEHLTKPARMALAFVERWGMVSAQDNGEDSSGRAKLKLLSPEDVVDRACLISGLLLHKFHELDWILDVPSMDELKAKHSPKEKEPA